MNSSNPVPPDDPNSLCDQESQRCLMYLFGELDADAAERFEQSLQHDAELCQRLASQAEIIARLGEAPPVTRSRSRQTLDSGAEHATAGDLNPPRRLFAFPAAYAAIAALAASILCLVWWSQTADAPAGLAAEDRLQTQRLADAWLVSYGTVRQPIDEPAEEEPVVDGSGGEAVPDELVEDWQETASPPDWMVAALVGLDAQQGNATEVSGG